MKLLTNIIFGIIISLLLPKHNLAQEANKATGNWIGKLELPRMQLELFFKISVDEKDSISALLDVPMQGAKDLHIDKVTATNDSLLLNIPIIAGTYKGEIVSIDTVKGYWIQAGRSTPLILCKIDSIPKINRPQTPKPPFPYLSEDVEYTNPNSGFKLTGTLTIPKNKDNCPAIVLISGSGAQDRDNTAFEHKSFWVIADYFARNGIAVLRVDDRGIGGSGGNISEATSKDFASDALAGVQFLKTRNEIDHSKIGLAGHSEGGIIAPIAANLSNDVSFIILMAGSGIIGEQILYKQGELINREAGASEEMIKQNRQIQQAIFDIILNETDSIKQIDRLQRTYSGGMYFMLQDAQKEAINQRIKTVNSPWFKYFLTYDPYPTLVKVKCPVLAMIGEKDLQVPPKENLEAIEKALTEGGNKNFKTIELPNLNHMFQNCKTGAISEYAQIEETIVLEVLDLILEWILEVTE